MYLPNPSRPALRGGRRRPNLSSYPHLPGVFPLQDDEETGDPGNGEADASDDSVEAVEY